MIRVKSRLESHQQDLSIGIAGAIEAPQLAVNRAITIHDIPQSFTHRPDELPGGWIGRKALESFAVPRGQVPHVNRVELVTPIEHRLDGDVWSGGREQPGYHYTEFRHLLQL